MISAAPLFTLSLVLTVRGKGKGEAYLGPYSQGLSKDKASEAVPT